MARAKVLVCDKLSDEGLAVLRSAEGLDVEVKLGLDEAGLAEAAADADALVIRSGVKVTAKVLAAAQRLKVVGRAGIGVDNVDVKEASRRGVVVMNTPTGNAVTTAEHALALLLSAARHIPQAAAAMKAGRWDKKQFSGRELSGKTLGVVGLGNIGRHVATKGRGLGMEVVGFDPAMSAERAAELGVELVELGELFTRADAISVHTPLTASTRHLIDAAALEKMKPGVLLVNAARGGIYDEVAVLRALDAGKVAAYAVDVYEEEPPGLTATIEHPKVIATPHLGASTQEAQERVAVEIAEQVVAYLLRGEVKNAVNVPTLPKEVAARLGPYVHLAERLGSFLSQVEAVEPRAVEVELAGEISRLHPAPVANAALAGLLDSLMTTPVNPVSAPVVAKDRGITVDENRRSEAVAFESTVTLTVTGDGGRRVSVCGALAADKSPRLTRWNGLELKAPLFGPVLVVVNEDKPGVIGAIGTLLGRAGINITRMTVGVDGDGGAAASLWALSTSPPEETLAAVRADPSVKRAYAVVL